MFQFCSSFGWVTTLVTQPHLHSCPLFQKLEPFKLWAIINWGRVQEEFITQTMKKKSLYKCWKQCIEKFDGISQIVIIMVQSARRRNFFGYDLNSGLTQTTMCYFLQSKQWLKYCLHICPYTYLQNCCECVDRRVSPLCVLKYSAWLLASVGLSHSSCCNSSEQRNHNFKGNQWGTKTITRFWWPLLQKFEILDHFK